MPVEKNRPGGDAANNSNADDNTAETGNTPASGNPGYQPIQFKGHAREYFGIWLTTLLLTVITLGIWSLGQGSAEKLFPQQHRHPWLWIWLSRHRLADSKGACPDTADDWSRQCGRVH